MGFVKSFHRNHLSGNNYPLWLILACGWVLMTLTFNIPNLQRVGPSSMGSMDAVGIIKLGSRLAVFGILVFILGRLWRHPKRPAIMRSLLPWGLFILWGAVSTSWSALKAVSLGQVFSLSVVFLLGTTISFYCNGKRDTSTVLFSLSSATIFISFGILMVYFLFPAFGALDRMGTGLLHPTTASATAALGMIILIASKLFWGWRWAKVLFVPGVLINSTLLFLAVNRAAVFFTVIIISIIVCVFTNRGLFAVGVFAVCLGGAIYLAADPGMKLANDAFASTRSYVQREQSFEQMKGFTGRDIMWRTILNSVSESPWLGHGYFVSSKTGSIKVWFKEGNWTAHNMVLQILVGTGAIGLLLFIHGLLRPIPLFMRGLRRSLENRKLLNLLLLIGCWWTGWSVTNESIAGPLQPESVLYFSLLGLGIGNAVAFLSGREVMEEEVPTPAVQTDRTPS